MATMSATRGSPPRSVGSIRAEDRGNAAEAPALGAILLVEDDAEVRECLHDLLVEMGYRVLSYADGRAALDALAAMSAPPDAVVTDLMMPVMSGWDLIDAIRSRPDIAGTPVVIVSALDLVGPNRQGLRVVRKPIHLEELVDAIERARELQRGPHPFVPLG